MKLAYLETDASVDLRKGGTGPVGQLYPAGGGIILRDIRLRPIVVKAVELGQVPGPLHAEYLALMKGLEEAAGLGARGVWAVTDNQRLVEAFNGRSKNESDGLAEIENQLKVVRARFDFVTLRWSRGSHRRLKLGGPTADALARAAIGLGRRK